ncbi:SGNH/GDSL hydrolase family protein [Streptomyces sp. NPDC057702]|uniref:SGNH/GDSL hydrolase family protein n=1 Tax=unclassified Streptomyces TaxID=2593676 RepID=UPI00368D8C73
MSTWTTTALTKGGPVALRGALEVEATARGVLPHRLPAAARAQVSDGFCALAEAQPSGVRLAFRTEATVVELDVVPFPGASASGAADPAAPDAAEPPASPVGRAGVYDLVVDGRLTARIAAPLDAPGQPPGARPAACSGAGPETAPEAPRAVRPPTRPEARHRTRPDASPAPYVSGPDPDVSPDLDLAPDAGPDAGPHPYVSPGPGPASGVRSDAGPHPYVSPGPGPASGVRPDAGPHPYVSPGPGPASGVRPDTNPHPDVSPGPDAAPAPAPAPGVPARDGVVAVRFEGLSGREQDVEIWLPHAAIVELVALRADAPLRPPRAVGVPSPRWVHHGSSISQGAGAAGPTGAWPAVAARLAGADLVNLGLSGNALLDPFTARAIRDAPADLISVKVGINIVALDAFRLRTLGPALHGFLDTVREGHPTAPLLVVSPLHAPVVERVPGPMYPDPDAPGPGVSYRGYGDPAQVASGALTLTSIRRELGRVVAQRAQSDRHLYYLDGLALYGERDFAELPLPDQIHPDDAAQRRIGERFAHLAFGPGGPFAATATATAADPATPHGS